MEEIKKMELDGWRMLSTGGLAARGFYKEVLADRAVMILPGGIILENVESILDSFDSQPWDWFRIEDEKIIHLSENAYLLYYHVNAQRQSEAIYSANVSSMYIRADEGWKLIFHQQTLAKGFE